MRKQENDHFSRHDDENNGNKRGNNNYNKGQRKYSDPSKKCQTDDHVMALDHPPCGRKTTTQEQLKSLYKRSVHSTLTASTPPRTVGTSRKQSVIFLPTTTKRRKTKMRKKTR